VFRVDETIVQAVARLVDDAGATREPSPSDLEELFRRVELSASDPHQDPAVRVGKQKRVRHVLRSAMDQDEAASAKAVTELLGMIRGLGGFRPDSPNYCGEDPIATCLAAFANEPVELTRDGELRPRSLAGLAGRSLTGALRSYVTRAQRGYEDSVLVAGTDKDLIEATAAHVLTERYGDYQTANFPTLLGQAFARPGPSGAADVTRGGGSRGRTRGDDGVALRAGVCREPPEEQDWQRAWAAVHSGAHGGRGSGGD
jgi:hypothetical protein